MTASNILETTDWSHLLHAHGTAEGAVPALKTLQGEDPDPMAEAVDVLEPYFLRQSTPYPATPAALRYILAILAEWGAERAGDESLADVAEGLSIFVRNIGFLLRRCEEDLAGRAVDAQAAQRAREILDERAAAPGPAAGTPTSASAAGASASGSASAAGTPDGAGAAGAHVAPERGEPPAKGDDVWEALGELRDPLIYNAGLELMGLTSEVLDVFVPRVPRPNGRIDLETLDTVVPWLVLPGADDARTAVLAEVCDRLDGLDPADPSQREERRTLVQVLVDLKEDLSGLGEDEDPAVRALAAISRPEQEGAVPELVRALQRMTEDDPEGVYGPTWTEIRDQADSAVIRVRAPLEALLPAALARIGASTGFLPDHDWLPLVTHGFPPSDGEVWERLLPETPSDAQIQVLAALADNPHQWDPGNEHAVAARSYLGLGSMSREELRALVDRHRAAGPGGRVTRVSRRAAARAAQSAQSAQAAPPTLPTLVVQPAPPTRTAQAAPPAQPTQPAQSAQFAPPTLPTPVVQPAPPTRTAQAAPPAQPTPPAQPAQFAPSALGPQPGPTGDASADGGAAARAPQP